MLKVINLRRLIKRNLQLSVLFLLILLVACSQGESNVDSGNRLGILHMGNGTEPQGLDPHVATGIPEHHIIDALFEGLVYKDPYTLEVQPGVAESWQISEDGKLYTFNFRKDAKWSNGDPVTAEDFRWSWWRALQPELGNQYVFMYFPIVNAERYFNQEITDFSEVGVNVIDDYTLQIELANPTPYFLQLLDHYSTFPVHRPTIEAYGEPGESYTRWTRPGNLVGNGAFVLEEWRLNKHIVVLPNEQYWDADRIELNQIKFYPVEKATIEERMFRAGQLHVTDTTALERTDYYRENHPELLKIAPFVGTYIYRINNKKEHLNDVRVRKALAMTIDRDTIMNTILNGVFTSSYSITPPGLLGYQPPKSFEYNPEEARRLLAEAGFPGGDGFPEFELQYNTNEQHKNIAVAVQQMWKKELNINIRLQNKDWKVYLDDENTGNFDISRGGWIGDYVDPNTFLDMWVSGSGLNRTGWASDKYDDLVLKQAPQANTREERFKAFYEAEQLMMDDMPFIPIYTYSSDKYKHPSLEGVPANAMNFYNFRYVSLNPDWSKSVLETTEEKQ